MARKKVLEESDDEENEDYSDQDLSDQDDDDNDDDDDNVFAPENNGDEEEKLNKEQNPQEIAEFTNRAPACQERLGPARKPLNAFSFFKAEEFDATRAANPTLTMMEVIDLIGQKWGELGKSKRAEYQQKFEQHKNMIVHPVKSSRNGTSGKMIIEATKEDEQDQKIIDSAKKIQKKIKV